MRIEGAGGAIEAVPIVQDHGDAPSLGFRFGNVAYSPDIGGIPESSIPLLQGLDLWIVDALRPMPHPSHFSVKQALDWIERLGVKRAILTHMTVELDYEALRRQLPPHVEPGYDGMVVEVDRSSAKPRFLLSPGEGSGLSAPAAQQALPGARKLVSPPSSQGGKGQSGDPQPDPNNHEKKSWRDHCVQQEPCEVLPFGA